MSDFDIEIYLKKMGKKVLFGCILGGLAELAAFLGTEPVPTEYVWLTAFAVEGVELLINYIKHKYLVE